MFFYWLPIIGPWLWKRAIRRGFVTFTLKSRTTRGEFFILNTSAVIEVSIHAHNFLVELTMLPEKARRFSPDKDIAVGHPLFGQLMDWAVEHVWDI